MIGPGPLEADLRAEDECVLGGTRAVCGVGEGRAFDVEDVLEVRGQVPVETGPPGRRRAARAGKDGVERQGALADAERVVTGRDLKGSPVAVADVEVDPRPDPCAAVGSGFTGEDVSCR